MMSAICHVRAGSMDLWIQRMMTQLRRYVWKVAPAFSEGLCVLMTQVVTGWLRLMDSCLDFASFL